MDGDVEQLAQLAHQVLDVRARAAVDLGRVFARQDGEYVGGRQGGAVGKRRVAPQIEPRRRRSLELPIEREVRNEEDRPGAAHAVATSR